MSKEMLFLCDVFDKWLDENNLPHRSADDILYGENACKLTGNQKYWFCLLYTSPSPRDNTLSRMPSSA